MIIFDSNVWVAFFNKEDSQNKKALEIVIKEKDNIAITEYIILEVSSILALKAEKNIADKFLEFILNNNNIKVLLSSNDFFYNTVENFIKTESKKLSFVDISLLYLSNTCQIITFDKDLAKIIKKFQQ